VRHYFPVIKLDMRLTNLVLKGCARWFRNEITSRTFTCI